MSSPSTLKATLGPTTRRLPVPTPLTFSTLQTTLTHHFNLSTPHILTYLDLDNDIVTVSSEVELQELVKTLTGTVLRVTLYPPHHFARAVDEHQRRLRDDSTVNAQYLRALDILVAALLELTSEVFVGVSSWLNRSTAVSVGAHHVAEMRQVVDEQQIVDHEDEQAVKSESSMIETDTSDTQRDAVPCAVESRWWDFIMTPERTPWRTQSSRLGVEAKTQFYRLVRYIYKSPERERLSGHIRDSLPVMRKWLAQSLTDEVIPTDNSINQLIQGVNAVVGGSDVEFAQIYLQFLRIALKDDMVLGILRRLRKVVHLDGPSEVTEGQCSRWKGFDVHFGTVCVSCDVKPIVGSRFMDVRRENFNLCSKCYYGSDVAQYDMQFRECRYVWESVLPPGVSVPPPRLSIGDRGPLVKFLNKLLMDVGAMTEDIYPGRIGMFGENTRAAVRRFQREHRSEEVYEDGVYDEPTAEKLADIVEGLNGQADVHNGEEAACNPGAVMSD